MSEDSILRIYAAIEDANWLQGKVLCQNMLKQQPEYAEILHLYGHILGKLGDTTLALEKLQLATLIAPAHPQYRYNYAVSLGEAGREQEAAVQYQACLRYQPSHRDALWNYGEMLRLDNHFEEAAVLFERLIEAGGTYPKLQHRLGVTYGALGRVEEAEAFFQNEMDGADADAATHWEYALFKLGQEEFATGFAHYHHRFAEEADNRVFCHDYGLPRWAGEWEEGAALLIHGEQGLGDEMMFASILPEVIEQAGQHGMTIILLVKPPLVRLFRYSFPDIMILPHRVGGEFADITQLPPITWQAAIGDLAVLFRKQAGDFAKARKPYLFADPDRVVWYKQYLEALEPGPQPELRVGLMWGSNPLKLDSSYIRWTQSRSIPPALFNALGYLRPRVRFVSLQNPERGAEASEMHKLDVLDLSVLQRDFYETAALVANMDLVFSVCTSVSHLAGGMGHPAVTALMDRADWRHGKTREQSYWYKNTRYFRQREAGDWTSVIARLGTHIEEMLAA
ncbi:hypothetical protein [Alterisphingorhabdus coralli]|uniref:Tetratricopeptide repeat protein n=1 Tax=Alterisphingorhabdus coralli TaxID=3071408 RepID=A0AA97F641_9SPHN|nr:hypothetical protein [Parasphingorhabdus sp. SCSIO 66989]WOE75039.1 hypothetical protein RB602_14580 [Parasphingorhabdus sp. SCSIO 66989]